MLTGKIKNQIDEIWETIWTGGISNPLSVIEQISYLLFIKRLDEIHSQKERIAQRTKKPIVEPIFSEAQRELRWSVFRDKDPQTLYVIVRDKAFPFIKTLQGEESRFAKHMEDAIFMMPDASLLDRVIQMIDDIDMKDRDTKGDVYEYLLSKIATAGVNGQFRTPRHIIKMMVAMLKPTLKDTMCDPASGTCGFLMATAEYINQHYPKELTRPEHRTHYNSNLFTGFDFDTHMLRIGAMNMMLHGIEQPRIEYRDSLAEVHDGEEAITEAYSLILANPPFKGSVNVDNISPDLLKALGKVKPTKPSSEAVDKNGTIEQERFLDILHETEIIFPAIKEYLKQEWNFTYFSQLEADDLVAIYREDCEYPVIASPDKDVLKQVDSVHFNYRTAKKIGTTKLDAEKFLWKQMLMGDSTDGIPGIPKVGEKTADKWLSDIKVKEMPAFVLNKFLEKFGNHEGIDKFAETLIGSS